MDCFLLFNILDHICTTCFVFANIFGKSFQSLLQIVKGIWIRLQEAFLRFEISPLFQMLFLWLKQSSPEWNSPLSFREGFNGYQLEVYLDLSFENIPIENIIPIEEVVYHKIPIWKTTFCK
jgi:hypothetical protein